MSYEVLVAVAVGNVGDIVDVNPMGFVWGSQELSSHGDFLVVCVDSSHSAADVREELLTLELVEEESAEGDGELNSFLQKRWRLRLSEFGADAVLAAWEAGCLEVTGSEFENNCESVDRHRFDPSADDKLGELWPDSAGPAHIEPSMQSLIDEETEG